jgi:hypothetical protein
MTTLLAKSIRAGHPTPGCGAKRVGEVVAGRAAIREKMVRGIRGVGGCCGEAVLQEASSFFRCFGCQADENGFQNIENHATGGTRSHLGLRP